MAAVNQEAPSDKSSAIAREAAAEPLEDGWQEEEEEEERLRRGRLAGVTHSLLPKGGEECCSLDSTCNMSSQKFLRLIFLKV